MKKCLIVINELSGHSKNVSEQKLREKYSENYDVDLVKIKTDKDEWKSEGYDLVVVCGGDGTFNRTVNKVTSDDTSIIYYSCGTFNECAKAKGAKGTEYIKLNEYATANKGFFGYVAAAGSFTPLGYIVPAETKKKLGIFAYLLKVVSQYKVYDISAQVNVDGVKYNDNYTVLMAIDSMRCFGFKFNRMYRPDDGMTHVLMIKSPGKNNFVNKIKVFFPLFRSFFIGFRKEVRGKKITFIAAKNVHIELAQPEVFDVDGDAKTFQTLDISVKVPKNDVYIGNFDNINKEQKNK